MKIKCLMLSIAFALSTNAAAGALSDYSENKIIDHVFRGLAFSESVPASYYVALYTSPCSDAGAGSEVSGGSYARVSVVRGSSTWKGTHGSIAGASSGVNGTITNASYITFPGATADWGAVSWWGIVDSAVLGSGNLIFCAPLAAARTITNGAMVSFPAGSLSIQIDN